MTLRGRIHAIVRAPILFVCAALCIVTLVTNEPYASEGAESDSTTGGSIDHGELNVLDAYEHPEDKEPHLPALGAMDQYFDWKASVRERIGLAWMIEYAPILQWGHGDFHADHELNLIGLWRALDHATVGTGDFLVWFQHALTWGDLTTSEFMDSLGVVSPVNGGDTFPARDANRLQLLAWEQVLPGERLRFMLGKITTRVTFNLNRYAVSDREDFFTPMIVNNPVVPFTVRTGLGVFAQYRRESWYLSGMVRDADAQDDYIDFESLRSGNWEYTGEVGWTPQGARFGEGNYRLTYHYTDEIGSGEATQAAGSSWSFSADQDLGKRVGVFLRYAYTDEPLRTFRTRVAVGAQLLAPFGFDDDRIGLGSWWGETVATDLANESGVEVFWRLQAARIIEVTPDVQLIFNPALDSTQDVVAVFGLRFRVVL